MVLSWPVPDIRELHDHVQSLCLQRWGQPALPLHFHVDRMRDELLAQSWTRAVQPSYAKLIPLLVEFQQQENNT